MEDDARRASPLLAYAALVCGGVFACLLLLAGPAHADSADPDGDAAEHLLPLGQVGDQVAETTREVGGGTSGLVRQATAPAARLAPVGEDVAEQVSTTTGRVADGVARVTHDVDEVVDEPAALLPDVPEAEEPDDAPQAGADRPRAKADRDRHPLRATTASVGVRAAPAHDPVPRGVSVTRTTPAATSAPAAVAPAISSPAGAQAPAVVPASAPNQLVAGCDDCAATGLSAGTPLLVLGLPTQGVTAPRFADSGPRDASVGGPATVFRRPDVSPD